MVVRRAERGTRRRRLLGVAVAVYVAVLGAALAPSAANASNAFQDAQSGGPEPVTLAALNSAPSIASVANSGCSGGVQQTNVALNWADAQSSNLDATGSFLVNGYNIERATAAAGPYASAGTTSGQPPATSFTDNPSGAAAPTVLVADGAANKKVVPFAQGSTTAGSSAASAQQFGTQPNTIAVTPDGKSAVLAEGGSNPSKEAEVVSISGTTISVVASITGLASRPLAVTIDPVPQSGLYLAYVLLSGGTVVPITINGASSSAGASITVGTQGNAAAPAGIVVTPDGSKVFVTNFGSASVSEFPTSGTPTVTSISLGGGAQPFALAVTPDSSHVYAADRKNKIEDLTVSSLSLSATITTGNLVDSNLTTGASNALALTPDGTKLYVSEFGAGAVLPVNTALASSSPDTAGTAIALPGSGPQPVGLAMQPNGCQLFVGDKKNDQIDVITVSSNTATTAVPSTSLCPGGVGSPFDIQVTPDSKAAWFTQSATSCHEVSYFDTSSNAVSLNTTATVNPVALAVTPSTYFYEVTALHGTVATGWSSNPSSASSITLGYKPGSWE